MSVDYFYFIQKIIPYSSLVSFGFPQKLFRPKVGYILFYHFPKQLGLLILVALVKKTIDLISGIEARTAKLPS